MRKFQVTVLGCGSAVPTSWHNPSSQMVQYDNRQFLVDCGEGTQMQMIRYKVKYAKLDHIFITHLHGDHFFGLIGLMNTLHLMRREKTLHLYAPKDLDEIIRTQLRLTNTTLFYPLEFHALEDYGKSAVLYEDKHLTISSFPLKHSIAVWGFLFTEKPLPLNIDKNFIEEYKPAIEQIKAIKQGEDYVTPEGKVIPNNQITIPPPLSRSFAYCSDTAYLESTADYVKGVDLLYHESTFDDSREELANITLHTTAAQAARVALNAGAKKLLLGHYSARFKKDAEILQKEAREIFPEAYLSNEGETYEI
ncbi:MAG: ribonuclease Z [Chlorobi bacterium]|nr:ribonuclease Z [Chlorobiota bacterium]